MVGTPVRLEIFLALRIEDEAVQRQIAEDLHWKDKLVSYGISLGRHLMIIVMMTTLFVTRHRSTQVKVSNTICMTTTNLIVLQRWNESEPSPWSKDLDLNRQ